MKIPRDLKPGDRLWYSKTEYATVSEIQRGECYFRDDPEDERGRICARTDHYVNYWCDTGHEYDNDTPPIIRIERIASAPAKVKREKVDKWAVIVWCRSRKHARETRGNIDNGLRKLEIRRMGWSKP